MPTLASDEILHAIRMFASYTIPFYFFYKGVGVPGGAFSINALALGVALTLVALPMRAGAVWLHRRLIQAETAAGSLRERFHISDVLYGALRIYAGMSTTLPSLHISTPSNSDAHSENAAIPKQPVKPRI